ncbi:MAG TPA: TlpA disulfide reductase family protein [Steroidobacteraceae bacterium]|nr:TlpA disulfide reductase family protein [Steroidobacteraceae bacterium]
MALNRYLGRWLAGLLGLAALMLVGITAAAAAPLNLVGQAAPDFALPAVDGDNVRLSEYLGQPVIVTFWSSRCAVCAAQLARLDRLYDTYRSSGLVVLAVSVDSDLSRAQRYARAHATHFPLLLDQAETVGRAYAIDRLPTAVLIDRSGVIRYVHDNDRSEDRSYITQIRALLDDADEAPQSALGSSGN